MSYSIQEIANQIKVLGFSFLSTVVVPVSATLKAHDKANREICSGTLEGELSTNKMGWLLSKRRLGGVLTGEVSVSANGSGGTLFDVPFKVGIDLDVAPGGGYLVSVKGAGGVRWDQAQIVSATQKPVSVVSTDYNAPLLDGYPNPITYQVIFQLGEPVQRWRNRVFDPKRPLQP